MSPILFADVRLCGGASPCDVTIYVCEGGAFDLPVCGNAHRPAMSSVSGLVAGGFSRMA